MERRQTPQPGGTYEEALHFDGGRWATRPRTYVDCTAPALPTIDLSRRLVRSQPGWELVELATGHDPMVSAPDELVAVLLEVAGRQAGRWPCCRQGAARSAHGGPAGAGAA